MLKGYTKEVEEENVREMKGGGMSERDAVMVSMKRSKAEKKQMLPALSSPSPEDFPYGLRLDLDKDALEKLGIDDLPDVGDTFHLMATVKVTSVSEDTTSDGSDHCSVCLQITNMSLE